jgi:hypothetical protein
MMMVSDPFLNLESITLNIGAAWHGRFSRLYIFYFLIAETKVGNAALSNRQKRLRVRSLDRLAQRDQKHHALSGGVGREKLCHVIIEEGES